MLGNQLSRKLLFTIPYYLFTIQNANLLSTSTLPFNKKVSGCSTDQLPSPLHKLLFCQSLLAT